MKEYLTANPRDKAEYDAYRRYCEMVAGIKPRDFDAWQQGRKWSLADGFTTTTLSKKGMSQ